MITKIKTALFNSNLVVLAVMLLPAFAMIVYNDKVQRELDSLPEVYGVEFAEVKPVNIAKKLPDQQECLAQNMYFEARGEGTVGMVSVANVTTSRVDDERYPKTVCKVVYQPKQFSWTNSDFLEINEPEKFIEAMQLAQKGIQRKLPNIVGTADHYVNFKTINFRANPWVLNMAVVARVKNHVYFDSKVKATKQNTLKVKVVNGKEVLVLPSGIKHIKA